MYLALVDPHAALYRYLSVARRKGYRTLVLTADPVACRMQEAHNNLDGATHGTSQMDKVLTCNPTSADDIVHALEPMRHEVAGLLPGNETSVAATFQAGRGLGFDCARSIDAPCQQVKTDMKRRLVERGVPTPRFRVVRNLADTAAAWEAFGRDCIIKMVDYVSSANVYRVKSAVELEVAWEAIRSNRLSIVVPFPLAKEAIVEEFIGGRELSVEGYVADQEVVCLNSCEKITAESFVVVGHYVPARLTPEERRSVESVATSCVRALGVRNSVFHVEVHLQDGVPFVIECAARPPGQHVTDLIPHTYGYDLMDVNVDLAVDNGTTVQPAPPRRHHALLALTADRPGAYVGVEGLEDLRARGGLVMCHVGIQAGHPVDVPRTFRNRYGFFVLEDATAEGVRDKANWARKNVRISVEAVRSPNSHDRVPSPTSPVR